MGRGATFCEGKGVVIGGVIGIEIECRSVVGCSDGDGGSGGVGGLSTAVVGGDRENTAAASGGILRGVVVLESVEESLSLSGGEFSGGLPREGDGGGARGDGYGVGVIAGGDGEGSRAGRGERGEVRDGGIGSGSPIDEERFTGAVCEVSLRESDVDFVKGVAVDISERGA